MIQKRMKSLNWRLVHVTKICVVSKAVTLKPEHVSESPGGFVKAEIVRACLRDSGSGDRMVVGELVNRDNRYRS